MNLLLLSLAAPSTLSAVQGAKDAAEGFLSGELQQFQSAPAAVEAPSLLPTILNVMLSLGLVVLLIYGVYWLLLKWRARQGLPEGAEKAGLIRVLERHFLGSRHAVAVVELGEGIYYLGLGQDVTLLGRVEDPEAVERLKRQAPLPASLMGFKEQLERVGLKLKRDQWQKAKQDLRQQSQDLEEQMGRLKGARRKDQA